VKVGDHSCRRARLQLSEGREKSVCEMDWAGVELRRAYFARLMHVTTSLFMDVYDPYETEEQFVDVY
jgi:hypothetical protein